MTVTLPGLVQPTEQHLSFGNDVLTLHIAHGPDTPPSLVSLAHAEDPEPDLRGLRRAALPVVEIALTGDGRVGTSGKRHVDGAAAARMRLVAAQRREAGGVHRLRLDLADPGGPLRASVHYELAAGSPLLHTWAELSAEGGELAVEYVSSAVISGLGRGAARWEEELAVWHAANPWSGEFRWTRATLAERGLIDVGMVRHGQVGSKNRVVLTSTGSWSTSEYLPMGVVEDTRTGGLLVWQVEHNGAWHVELGERYDTVYLAVSGPTAAEHQWAAHLTPGTSFRTVPAALAVIPGRRRRPVESALAEAGAALTAHRRRVRRPHPDHGRLPVVYNDFLNALMADPTTERELPLIAAAADLGAEVYCIDAGWYDDEDGGWWDAVGAWEPSTERFPGGGLAALVERIHAAGMTPGLWLEPEVVGVRSPLARTLPPEAFFQRDGHRVVEWGRYQLDLRHPAARAHLDAVVDRLVPQLRLGYLKLDYNVDIGVGTDAGRGEPAGAGLLGHNRAFLDWVTDVLHRYPDLVVEGCAAGGSRTDGASSAVFPIQSLTDQQDFRLVAPIAAAAPLAITPEQSGVWASVDGTMSHEEIAFALVSSLLARVHLSGRIDTLTEAQRAVVREGLAVHRTLRNAVAASTPSWPLGLPDWRAPWIALGASVDDGLLLAVWRRDGEASVRVPLPPPFGGAPDLEVTVLYPTWGGETVTPARDTDGTAALDVALPGPTSARLLHVRTAASPPPAAGAASS